MKIVLVFGTVTLLSCIIAGCNQSRESTVGSIVGVWDCHAKGEGGPSYLDVDDTKTFGADGLYSSTKFAGGIKYKYRLDGDKLITSLPTVDWIEKVTRLPNDSLEIYDDKLGKPVR